MKIQLYNNKFLKYKESALKSGVHTERGREKSLNCFYLIIQCRSSVLSLSKKKLYIIIIKFFMDLRELQYNQEILYGV